MAIRKAQGSEQGSEQGSGRRLQGVEHLRQTLCADTGPEEVAPVDAIRDVGGEAPTGEVQAGGGPPRVRKPGKGFRWSSLKERHLALTRDGYEPPPPKEYPVEVKGGRGGKPKLTDEQVEWLRSNPEGLTIPELAKRLGLAYQTVLYAAQGVTYRRLNVRYPPRI